MHDVIRSLRELGPVRFIALAGWKVLLAARRARDRNGGYERLVQRTERWKDRWLQAWRAEGFAAWIRRGGAGRLWIDPDSSAEWCRESCTELDLEIARASADGVFDLVGSGPVDLGSPPEWRRDLYAGIVWPLDEASRMTTVRPDDSDIRTVWELSRGYHFIALARAYWTTGDGMFRDAFVQHADSWLEQNPLGYGPHWTSPMDAAVRAANWSLAATLFADAEAIPADFWARLLANLRATARYVWRYREWHSLYRGNHYLADMVGLVYVGALFGDEPAGRRWLDRGSRILAREIQVQVLDDGVSFEGSLAYHRLVTEFFAFGGEVIRRNRPRYWTDVYRTRLRGMYRFIATYMPRTGEAPMIGDADDERLHAISAQLLRNPRLHLLGLPDGWWPEEEPLSTAFPQGGFYVIRHEDDHCIIRCGPVGLKGAGSHDHNDQLSFELVVGGHRVICDSGMYCYTRDLAARHRFRRTAAHSVVQVEGQEQNPIRVDRPWRILEDRTQASTGRWEVGRERIVFEGEHYGFRCAGKSVRTLRRVTCDLAGGAWLITDVVEPPGQCEAIVRFYLTDRSWELEAPPSGSGEEGFRCSTDDVAVQIAGSGRIETSVETLCSHRYGGLLRCRCIAVQVPRGGTLHTAISQR